MRKILIIGSGKSTPYLIKFLLDQAPKQKLNITIAGLDLQNVKQLTNKIANVKTLPLDALQHTPRANAVKNSDLVISMLPASQHIWVAKDCLEHNKHLITASYVSPEMETLNKAAQAKGLIFLNEMGLDPGIDHMSAMQTIDQIKDLGGQINTFKSYTGGLVAPQQNPSLWNYKFTWNPRNVVIAGQGSAAKFLQSGQVKYTAYQQLFKRTQELNIDNVGKFEAYANRDALKYQKKYKLQAATTLFRGTLRPLGFCNAWHTFVALGITDDNYTMNTNNMSYPNFIDSFLPHHPTQSIENKLKNILNINSSHPIYKKLNELNIFNPNKKIPLKKATPAQVLEYILTQNWTLKPKEKDMVIMRHEFEYTLNQKKYLKKSTLVSYGKDQTYTAMAKTVGLPLGMAALAILNKKITTTGVQIPTSKQIYNPVLQNLKDQGIAFNEHTSLI